jgi:ABC-type lipoprotein export system ATPase subunit
MVPTSVRNAPGEQDLGKPPMLELDRVWRWYGDGDTRVDALHEVSLKVADGEFLAVTGPSGSGKSTLLQIMGLLDRASEGAVSIAGRDVGHLSDGERTRLRLHQLGFVFQRFHLLPTLSAIENVALPMEAAGVGASARYDRAAELLASVGLAERLTFLQSQLSGGQRQRVAIARALANDPRLILADEPTGALHTEDQAQVVELLHRLHRDGRTVIVVTHDLDVAAQAQRRVEIRDGRISPAGSAYPARPVVPGSTPAQPHTAPSHVSPEEHKS